MTRLLVCIVLTASMIWNGSQARAQFDLGVERTLLLDLLCDGKYKQALSEARRIEKVVRPTKSKKVSATGPGTMVYIDLLIYRGTIERRMGNLDDADKTLTEAFKLLNDPAYQQFIARSVPTEEKERDAYFLSVEMPYLQLIDNGTEVLLERIRNAHESRQLQSSQQQTASPGGSESNDDGTTADTALEERGKIVGWFRQVDELIRLSQATRSTLRGRFSDRNEEGEDASLNRSPQARMMMSQSRSNRYIGMRYLEASLLPWTLSFDTDTPGSEDEPKRTGRRPSNDASREPTNETPAERQRQAASQRLRATAYLEKAEQLSEAAMTPAFESLERERQKASQDVQGDPAAFPQLVTAQKDAARIRAEILVPQARVAYFGGELDDARKLIDRAVTGLREAEVPDHPELARPLIVSAEVAFAESRRSLAAEDAITAREKATIAAESLQEARRILTSADSEFDPAAPLHLVLANQLATVESFEKSSSQTAAANSAADAAARRAMAALKNQSRPKPAPAPAPAPPAAGKSPAPAPPATPGGGPQRPAPSPPTKAAP